MQREGCRVTTGSTENARLPHLSVEPVEDHKKASAKDRKVGRRGVLVALGMSQDRGTQQPETDKE